MKFLASIILLIISTPNLVLAANCFEIEIGGWAFNGHEQKTEAENLIAGMKSPTAQVLKCTQEVDGWGRKNKKLAISN